MISARSHRQLLNGNKFLLLGIIACWSLTSCAMFQKAESDKKKTDQGDTLEPIQGRRVYDPEKGTYVVIEEALQEKMDTIIWKDIPTSTYPPITSAVSEMPNDLPGEVVSVDRNTGSEFFSSYNVAILLPFLTDKMNLSSGSNSTLPENSAWALNFYSGARLALDVLNDEGVNLNVSVIDTKASEETCTALARTNTDLRNAHLIIGPYRRNNVAIMAQLAKEQDIVLVSPFTAATGVSTDNPNYIQVNPTLEAHCKTIMRHALRSYGPENIVLVSKDVPAERARLQYFHDEYKQEMNNRVTIPLREFIIRDESANFNQLNVMPFVSLGDTAVFIVPSWSDETFIYALLRKIELSKSPESFVVVYGMPQWITFDKIDFSYYEKLHIHISASSYIDPISVDVQSFKRQYFDRFGAVPVEESFLGYDVTLYFGRMLHKYGSKFQRSFDRNAYTGLQTRFDFQPVMKANAAGSDRYQIEQYENSFIHILKFQDYQFRPADD